MDQTKKPNELDKPNEPDKLNKPSGHMRLLGPCRSFAAFQEKVIQLSQQRPHWHDVLN